MALNALTHQFALTIEHGKELARIGEGSCFGELALLRQDTRAATVIALTSAQVGWGSLIAGSMVAGLP